MEGRYGGGKLIRVEDRGAVIKGIPNFVITLLMFLRKLVSGVALETHSQFIRFDVGFEGGFSLE